MIDILKKIEEHIETIEALKSLAGELGNVARKMTTSLAGGGKIMWMGNGGSAADCQHLAAEFVGRYDRERKGLASIALTTDSSILTSVGNDYGYEQIFVRQVAALCQAGDIAVGISTSGNSANVNLALRHANELGAVTVGFTGGGGGTICDIADHCLIVPSTVTPRIQEAHILMGHLLCDWVEADITDRDVRQCGRRRKNPSLS